MEHCDIYLEILGKDYGFEDSEGISPTEREFNHATKHNKTRLIFIANIKNRNQKEISFINKVQNVLVRKSFSAIGELKSSVYASLVKYLMEKEIIRTAPFDASFDAKASIDNIEVWNPGSLPLGWTTEKLKKLHSSVPANPLLAEPMYLTAFIERLGTGTTDIIKKAKRPNLKNLFLFKMICLERLFIANKLRKLQDKLQDK